MPRGVKDSDFQESIARSIASSLWARIEILLDASPAVSTPLPGTIASTAALRNALSKSHALNGDFSPTLSITRPNGFPLPTLPRHYYYDDGVFSGESTQPFRARTSDNLPPVIITTTPGEIVVDWAELERSLGRRAWMTGGLGFPLQYYGADCARASETYLAVNEAANALEDDADEMDAASNATASYICEPLANVPNGADKILCIDLFIQSSNSLLMMEGDERGFNTNAKYTTSRAQIYVNAAGTSRTVMLNHSQFVIGSPVAPYRHLPKDVVVSKDPNGTIHVHYEIYNGACTYLGRAVCPSIDGNMTAVPLSNGEYFITYDGDQYPSIQVNQWINGAWKELARRSEHPGFGGLGALWLNSTLPKTQEMRNNNQLPPGCEIE